MNNNLFSKIPQVSKKKQKKRKKVTNNGSVTQTQPVFCTICKIECNSVQHYEKHVSGKKHNKTLRKMYVSMMSSVQLGNSGSDTAALDGQGSSASADLEGKKQKLLECGTAPQCLRMCNICNVACNGEIVYYSHIAGKKHISQARALSVKTNITTNPVSNPGTNSQNTAEKTTPVIGQAYCEVCKISCTSSDCLVIHRQGKKHKKNLESLRNSISTITPSSSSSIPVGSMSVSTAVVTVPESEELKKKVARSVEPVDLETKKRRIMESGGDEGNVRTCAICNVVCNSEQVFSTHLAGKMHASLVRRAEAIQPGL